MAVEGRSHEHPRRDRRSRPGPAGRASCALPAVREGPARRRAGGEGRAGRRLHLGLPPLRLARRHAAGQGRTAPGPPFRSRRSPPAARPPEPATGLPDVAARLWAARRPIGAGTVAGRYLVEVRGCALPPPDGHLAWHPDVYHPAEERSFPALLALVTHAVTGAPMTLHRTFLAPDGSGKAPVAKAGLLVKGGDKVGGVVRLWPDEGVTTGLCVAEGIETALTAARGFGLAWACLDAGNLAILPVLPGVEALTVVADHDTPNPKTGRRAGLEAAHECARRWLEAGREVRVWKAPAEGADLNDYAREAAA